MKKALDDAGFDEKNDNHVFVSCGDLFDRGVENRKVYDFIRCLKRKVLICGNHDERLLTTLLAHDLPGYEGQEDKYPFKAVGHYPLFAGPGRDYFWLDLFGF